MNKTQAGRLLTLAWYLRHNVKNSQFDLGFYASVEGTTPENAWPYGEGFQGSFDEVLEKYPKCGTTACALGHATNVWPNTFRLNAAYGYGDDGLVFGLRSVGGGIVGYNGYHVCNFFGLETDEANFLFSPHIDRTNIQEAKVIEDLVKSKGWVYA